jgi:hypothetical protein
MVPNINPQSINHALITEFDHSRCELIHIFRQYKYVGISIDGVTIKSRKFLNIDIVNSTSDTLPFTYNFFEDNSFDTNTFVDKFCDLLIQMKGEGLHVAGVTSDGCAFQVKALSWRDEQSIQARDDHFSKILFVPCICHRLQNAMIALFKENGYYRELIEQARKAAIVLRKPWARVVIGSICPAYCATRWIYDYPLVKFLCKHFAQANHLLLRKDIELSPQIMLLIPLLEKIFNMIRIFEADDAPLACVVPEITNLLLSLQKQAHCSSCNDVTDIYLDAITIIRFKCLQTSNFIFHLAYVLTPTGRMMARDAIFQQTMTETESFDVAEAEFEDHMNCEELQSRYDSEANDEGDQDILETEEEDRETLFPEEMADASFNMHEHPDPSERPLHLEAEEGLE